MIDHIGIAVSNAERSRAFYDAALAPLGISMIMKIPGELTESGGDAYGYGSDDTPFFWFGDNEQVGEGFHVAFVASTHAAVDAFHRAAIAAGATDNGSPGIRTHYGQHYYAAFVHDPDGHNVEAVCNGIER